MKRKLMIIMVLALSCISMSAGSRGGRQGFELRKHEVSVSGAVAPAKFIAGYDFNFLRKAGLDYGHSLADKYFDAATYEVEKTSLLWSLNYYYNINRLFAVGASFSYEGGSNSFYSRADDSLINRESKNILTTMAHFRVSWLNRTLVRMYSEVALGAAYSMEGDYTEPIEHVTFHLAPVGISVGKSLYGFAELGVGTYYIGTRFGIGYRF